MHSLNGDLRIRITSLIVLIQILNTLRLFNASQISTLLNRNSQKIPCIFCQFEQKILRDFISVFCCYYDLLFSSFIKM